MRAFCVRSRSSSASFRRRSSASLACASSFRRRSSASLACASSSRRRSSSFRRRSSASANLNSNAAICARRSATSTLSSIVEGRRAARAQRSATAKTPAQRLRELNRGGSLALRRLKRLDVAPQMDGAAQRRLNAAQRGATRRNGISSGAWGITATRKRRRRREGGSAERRARRRRKYIATKRRVRRYKEEREPEEEERSLWTVEVEAVWRAMSWLTGVTALGSRRSKSPVSPAPQLTSRLTRLALPRRRYVMYGIHMQGWGIEHGAGGRCQERSHAFAAHAFAPYPVPCHLPCPAPYPAPYPVPYPLPCPAPCHVPCPAPCHVPMSPVPVPVPVPCIRCCWRCRPGRRCSGPRQRAGGAPPPESPARR